MFTETHLNAWARSCLLCLSSSSSIPLNGINTCWTSGWVSKRLQKKKKNVAQFSFPNFWRKTNEKLSRLPYSFKNATFENTGRWKMRRKINAKLKRVLFSLDIFFFSPFCKFSVPDCLCLADHPALESGTPASFVGLHRILIEITLFSLLRHQPSVLKWYFEIR